MGDNSERQGAAGMIRRAGGEQLVLSVPAPPVDAPNEPDGDRAPPAAAAAAADAGAGAGADGGPRDEEGIVVTAYGFREAAELLEGSAGAGGGPVRKLVLWQSSEKKGEVNRSNFVRFVAALRRRDGGTLYRPVRSILIGIVDWRVAPEDATAQLFGEVLPAVPGLESLCFAFCDFSLPHFRLLTSSMPTAFTRLKELRFHGGTVDREQAQAIADMISRNVPLATLAVMPFVGGGLDADSCRIICQSASSNKNLRDLRICVKEAFADTLDNVAAPSSSLNQLTVQGAFSDEAVEGLAGQLRTNTTMTQLVLYYQTDEEPLTERPELFRPIEDVLDTYNFTLDVVTVSRANAGPAAQARIDDLLLRNRQIRRALLVWQSPPPGGRGEWDVQLLLPHAYALAGSLPTLLYRLLRRGDANELRDLVVRQRQQGQGPNKRRRAPDEGEGEG